MRRHRRRRRSRGSLRRSSIRAARRVSRRGSCSRTTTSSARACRSRRGSGCYPAQVEAVLVEHPAVAEACVVGAPDEAQGERVKALVVLKDGAAVDAAELVAYCRARLIKWSCPRDVEFRSELPKTRLGKIDFSALVRDATASAA